MLEYNATILLLKVVLSILGDFTFANLEELVKDWRQQEKEDSIQDNNPDLSLWPRNQAIHTNDTVNMGKKRHFLLEIIGDTTTFMLRVPSNGSLPLNSPCLQ